jgi:hypothetical protein
VIIQTYASRLDLTDQPLLKPETEWFTDRSSSVLNGKRKAGYAVVSPEEVTEAWPLPAGTSAQKAELRTLTRALTLGKGKMLNIHTDSKYAFLILHAHAALCKERELLSRKQFPNKTWEGNPLIIRGYPPTKGSGSDPLLGTSKRSNFDVTGEQLDRPKKATQAALQPLGTSPASILALFPPQEST